MCTISDTKVTTAIIVTVRRSMRNPTWKRKVSPAAHVYTSPSRRAPCITCQSAASEAANEIATDRIADQCANALPSFQPKKPASAAPTSGENAAIQESVIKSMVFLLSLEAAQVVHVDRAQVAEERDEDREPDRRLGRRHREDEEHEHLAGEVAQLVREGDEVRVDGKQHQLDRHQQDDEVLPVEEDADHADREEERAEDEVMAQRDHSFTIFRRSALVAESCSAGFWYFVSLRPRSVSAIAATIATSRITAAISK